MIYEDESTLLEGHASRSPPAGVQNDRIETGVHDDKGRKGGFAKSVLGKWEIFIVSEHRSFIDCVFT